MIANPRRSRSSVEQEAFARTQRCVGPKIGREDGLVEKGDGIADFAVAGKADLHDIVTRLIDSDRRRCGAVAPAVGLALVAEFGIQDDGAAVAEHAIVPEQAFGTGVATVGEGPSVVITQIAAAQSGVKVGATLGALIAHVHIQGIDSCTTASNGGLRAVIGRGKGKNAAGVAGHFPAALYCLGSAGFELVSAAGGKLEDAEVIRAADDAVAGKLNAFVGDAVSRSAELCGSDAVGK